MRRLILLRHAKSDWPEGVPDLDRPLAPRGRMSAPVVARYLAAQDLTPDVVLVSPARRTQETWALIAPDLPRVGTVQSEPRIYEASVARLLDVVRGQSADCHVLMLVGHNPGLEDLAEHLVASGAAPARHALEEKFPTGALAVIDLPVDDWKEVRARTGRLDRFITPRSLNADA